MEAEGEENEEKATDFKIEASDAFDAGDFAKAVEKYSEAIKVSLSTLATFSSGANSRSLLYYVHIITPLVPLLSATYCLGYQITHLFVFCLHTQLGAGGALVHAKRARALLKLKRPYAAKLDCDKALEINSDSATAYKARGMAYR